MFSIKLKKKIRNIYKNWAFLGEYSYKQFMRNIPDSTAMGSKARRASKGLSPPYRGGKNKTTAASIKKNASMHMIWEFAEVDA
jgi:hypothetical protein